MDRVRGSCLENVKTLRPQDRRQPMRQRLVVKESGSGQRPRAGHVFMGPYHENRVGRHKNCVVCYPSVKGFGTAPIPPCCLLSPRPAIAFEKLPHPAHPTPFPFQILQPLSPVVRRVGRAVECRGYGVFGWPEHGGWLSHGPMRVDTWVRHWIWDQVVYVTARPYKT